MSADNASYVNWWIWAISGLIVVLTFLLGVLAGYVAAGGWR